MADRYQDKPFPADDNYGRDDYRASAKAESDPLAELARLIGQTDPFGNLGRGAQPAAHHEDHYESQDAGDAEVAAGPPPWMQKRMAQSHPQQDFEAEPHPVLRRAAVYPDQPHFQPHELDSHPADPGRYDDALYGQMPEQQGAYDDQYADGQYPDEPYGYGEGTDDQPPRRRSGIVTVMAVLALAVVGTGAAFAYRTYVGSARSGTPPVIKADAGPNKIIPQQTGSGDAVGKLIQDRMSSNNGTEQMVSREEQPVDVKGATTSGPRVVFPPLNQNANPPTAASVAPSVRPPAAPASGTIAGDEPRKIKTLTVHGDQADAAAVPAAARSAAPAQAAVAPVAARRAPPAPAAVASTSNAPLSLSPQASAAEPRTRVASTNPTPQPVASSAASGGYVVQVSSQRNEADAQASFRALQGKFPSVLASRAPLIKRADLGPKGVYYRAMVGPFGSPEEASHFCGNLKSAGGQCVVQRN
ncbi:MAG: SPOR domain-containing protein [Proteobacteria bacterium]|nr:SPOR domain-containing protein [Pseudomonadota bacterium]